jgi:hypothetical protein
MAPVEVPESLGRVAAVAVEKKARQRWVETAVGPGDAEEPAVLEVGEAARASRSLARVQP